MFKIGPSLYALYDASPVPVRNVIGTVYALWSSQKKYGRHFGAWSGFLAQSQWWDREALRAFQVKQMQDLVAFIGEASPFYRTITQQRGISRDTIRAPEDIKAFPIIDKPVVREHYAEIKTAEATDKFLVLATSGTTGVSLHVPLTREALQREYAFRWLFQSIGGAKRGDRFALFTGHSVIPVKRKKPPFHIRNFADNAIMFSLYHMTDSTLETYVKEFNEFKPQYVYGYPSGVFVLADYVRRTGKPLFSPKAVYTASEKLHRHQREVIEKAFSAPLYEWFGQVETTVNVQECSSHRLHVKEEYGYLELLKDDGSEAAPGEMGSVVGTGWGNRALPLIRYRTGDMMLLAADQHCPCGRGGRIIEEIIGRDDDIIKTPDGRFIGRLDFVFKPIETIKERQIVQESLDSLLVRVVPTGEYGPKDEQRIIHELRSRIGDTIGIRVETVPEIPRSKGGKVRYVISNVMNGYSKGK